MSEPGGDPSRLDRAVGQLKVGLDHFWRLLSNAIPDFAYHRGTQLAASMAYYALLSVFPTAIVLAAGAGFVLDDPGARDDAINYLLEELPLNDEQGRSDIETLLDGVVANSGTLGAIGLLALLFTASGLISATRNAVGVIHNDQVRRGALRGKGLDLLLVLGLGVLFAVSFAITLLAGLDIRFEGRVGDAIEGVLDATGAILPVTLTVIVFTVLYRVLPTRRPPLRDIWPAILFATIGYELLKRLFSFYLEQFADYNAIYGSLGAVIAFLFFVWLASIVFLLGAEMVALWPGVRRGDYDPDPDEQGEPFRVQVRNAILGLFRRNPVERD